MNYGEKLKKTIQQSETTKLNAVNTQVEQQNRAALKERIKIERLITDLECDILYAIEIGSIPQIKVTDYSRRSLIDDSLSGKSKFQELWNQFTMRLQSVGLDLQVKYEHDGMGMESWLVISVDPLD